MFLCGSISIISLILTNFNASNRFQNRFNAVTLFAQKIPILSNNPLTEFFIQLTVNHN
jgi:hypothetical protein